MKFITEHTAPQFNANSVLVLPFVKGDLRLPVEFQSQKAAIETWLTGKEIGAWKAIAANFPHGEQMQNFVFYCVDEAADARNLTKLGSRVAKAVLGFEMDHVTVAFAKAMTDEHIFRFLTAFSLGMESFDKYKEKKQKAPINCVLLNENGCYRSLFEEVEKLVAAVSFARFLGNEPANVIYPETLVEQVLAKLPALGVNVKVLGLKEIQELGMEAFYNVAKGSIHEPRFLVMEYYNQPASDKRLALVGKGLTFDSGGYSIKPTDSMLTMKSDMCGSAAVIGAMHYIASTKAAVNVVAVVASCENMISGAAYKPGDIIGSMAGKFIEINNTDAEGRLTLADAVYYAHKELNATHIIDICTLTGACVVALGEEITGVMTNDEQLWDSLNKGVAVSGDKIWRMPIDEDMLAGLRSDVADMKNTGPRWGGMMTAGLFVREFTGGKPWMHLDIAGAAHQSKSNDFYPAGATGVGVEYLVELAKNLFA